MAYTSNPNAPKVRRDAVLFSDKYGVRTTARRYGVSQGTISKWRKHAVNVGLHPIPTRSSRPKHSPRALDRRLVGLIIDKRIALNRSAEVVHKSLSEDGVTVSLMSVKRTIDRAHLTRKAESVETVPCIHSTTVCRCSGSLSTSRYRAPRGTRKDRPLCVHLYRCL